MRRFIFRRIIAAIFALFVATIVIFAVSRVYGDPLANFIPKEGYGLSEEEKARVKASLHLDRAVPVQYAYWISDIATGKLGIDLSDRRPLSQKFIERLGPTLRLALPAWVLTTVLGVTLGVLSAVKRNSIWDYIARFFAISGQAVPTFWIALMAILTFAIALRWLPAATMGEGISVRHYILPIAILTWGPMAAYLRLTRTAMLEILDSEYVKLARTKGLPYRVVIWKHALRNSIIPAMTLSSVLLVGLIEGSVQVEVVFAWPGIARWGVDAVYSNNLNVLALVTLFFTAMFLFANLIVDLAYGIVDPRIRYS